MVIERLSVVNEVDPVTSSAWGNLTRAFPTNLFQSPRWIKVLQETYGFEFKAAVLHEGGEPVAGVPYWVPENLDEQGFTSLPFSDFCGIIAQDPRSANILAARVMRDGNAWNLRTFADQLAAIGDRPKTVARYLHHQVDCRSGPEGVFSGFGKSVRRSIKWAGRAGVSVRAAESRDELRKWFLLHLRLRKQKYGLLVQPYSFFESLWDEFIEKEDAFLLLAYYEGEIIGGELDIVWQDVVYSKFAATSLDHTKLRANQLLVWEGLRETCRRGCTAYDMGRTPGSHQGLIDFKRSLGADESEIVNVQFGEPEPPSPATLGNLEVAVRLSKLFSDASVPDDVSEKAGALLYRYFA